jgi:hypothetical protein
VLGLTIQDIGASWPHHIFVDKDFEVLGATWDRREVRGSRERRQAGLRGRDDAEAG